MPFILLYGYLNHIILFNFLRKRNNFFEIQLLFFKIKISIFFVSVLNNKLISPNIWYKKMSLKFAFIRTT